MKITSDGCELSAEYQMYRQHYGKNVGASVEAQGFRPPPVRSIFARSRPVHAGQGDYFTRPRPGGQGPGIDNVDTLPLRKADFFNVSFIVSLAALIFFQSHLR
jgi:hypothetical protein